MNAKRILLVVGVFVLGAALFVAGTAFAQSRGGDGDRIPYGWGAGHMNGRNEEAGETGRYGGMVGPNMHAEEWDNNHPGDMMGDYGTMMGDAMHAWDEDGRWSANHPHGSMMPDFGDVMGPGMMGGWGGLADVEPLSVDAATQAVAQFVAEVDEEELAVGEVMIFNNHAYVQVMNTVSGEGAFEVLVDPLTGAVYPEPGPNMMWNSEYGHMSSGMPMSHMSGMMGGHDFSTPEGEAAVAEAEAITLAQAYLDDYLPGATADDHAETFPGYYTLHVLRDGTIAGMLSVNGFSGDIFPHTWHGDFVEMAASHAE